MIDALLHAVKDAIIAGDFDYGKTACDVRDGGEPPPRCGDKFVAVHQGDSSSDMQNALNELFSYSVTLTMRVTVPLDRIGDSLLAKKVAREIGFNRRCEALRSFLHMNWTVLGEANTLLCELANDDYLVYGFCEPAMYASMELPQFVGGEWFGAQPDAKDIGLKSELRFERCRRLQALQHFV